MSFNSCLQNGTLKPRLAAEISQSPEACLIAVRVAPRSGLGKDGVEITWGAMGGTFSFRFHNVPVSSQHSKRAQRDLSTSVRKCTLNRSQCLTHFSREIGVHHIFAPLNSNDCTFHLSHNTVSHYTQMGFLTGH